ncbi:carnitine 3-dehydrogenase [Jannaschia seohaensis]|uniref:L-carnitine dehydrogenase n=1 Tax=Jannaschia seohaensis TaxID=475081 RepID=A0A2Y9B188_9RHOB|nr:carnitine 3-dehydrogenase [Jannaschia seohaensis]PWJ16894.1 carnitine 3-dehydrogenase [Jannaschia seohaensis]SSA48089.1 carnitine 3-dehydrogenase [Jannaschia seohaensis]
MKAAIIGGGVIGGGWAARFLLNGHDVAVYDPAPDAARRIEAVLAGARRAFPMLYDVALPPEGRLSFHDRLEDAVQGAAWVQESVPEQLDLKHRVIAQVQEASAAPLGSSTSGFTPSELSQSAADPARIVVTHPFNPVYLLPLVELVGHPGTDAALLDGAETMLRGLGMYPLRIRAEIPAHIADRLLEAVWREALWLVRDGQATTAEIDEAIRMGFGLRWAQMGLFETYRIAGGEAGMAHFIAQFGPALAWPWTRLTDVPELTDDLIATIAGQSDAQSGQLSIRELERVRDDNLVGILRGLKARGQAAGAVIGAHEAALAPPLPSGPVMRSQDRIVPIDWTDYNGHMNEGRYGQVFSDASEWVLAAIGTPPAAVAETGLTWFTVSSSVEYRHETMAGERFVVDTRVVEGGGKKLRLAHEMRRAEDGTLLAEGQQLLLHVDLSTRRSSPPPAEVAAAIEALCQIGAP